MSRNLTLLGAIPATIAIGLVAVSLYGGDDPRNESASADRVPRQSSRARGGTKSTEFPANAGQQSQRSLRAWAAAMDDAGLARAAARLADQLPADGGDDPSAKALICAVLKEWGSRDVDAALAFVSAFDADWQGRTGDPHFHLGSPGSYLNLAVLVGHSETDAGDAWRRLSGRNTVGTGNDFILPLPGDLFTLTNAEEAAAADLLFRNFLRQSPEGALDALRVAKREGQTDFTWNEGLLTCLAGIEDPTDRLSLFNELVPMQAALARPEAVTRNSIDAILNNPNRRIGYSAKESTAKALAGLAARDPAQAWQVLEETDGDAGRRSELAESFIRICSSRQQEKALGFIEERLRDSGFVKPSVSLALCLLPHHPELAIEVISRRPREILPDVRWDELLDSFEVPQTTATPWPVAEGVAAPPDPDEFRTRALRALENAALDEETRDALLKRLR
jgi:hypothetical protein